MKKCIAKKSCGLLYLSIFKQKQANMNVFNELSLFRDLFADEQYRILEQFI